MPIDELPNRRALLTALGAGRRARLPAAPVDGDERWSVVRSTPLLTPDGEVQLVVNVFRDITKERRRGGADALPRRGEHPARGLARLRGDARRSREAARAALADYCIVDALDEDGRLRQVVISHRDPEREELLREVRRRYPPEENERIPSRRCSGAASRTSSRTLAARRSSRAAVDEEHLDALPRARGDVVHRRPARGARPPARDDLARHRRVATALRSWSTSSSRTRSRAERRSAIDNALLFGTAQQSYAQLDTLLVSAPVGIGFWDRDLRFIRVNDALAAINGLTPEEHVGKPLADVIGELSPVLEPLYRRVLESGEPVVHTESTDDEALRMGERRHWLSSYYPVRTPDGEVIGVGAVIMEITDRKRADDRLRLLAEAGELFSSSLDQEEIASRIAQVAVPRLADTCNVYLADGTTLRRVACVSADPEVQPVLESLPALIRPRRARAGPPRRRVPLGRAAAAADGSDGVPRRARALRRRPRGVRADRHPLADAPADRRPRPDAGSDHARLASAGALRRARSSTSARSSRAGPASRWTTPGWSASFGAARRLRRRSSSSATASSWSAATG